MTTGDSEHTDPLLGADLELERGLRTRIPAWRRVRFRYWSVGIVKHADRSHGRWPFILMALAFMALLGHLASNPDARARVSRVALPPTWRGPSEADLDAAARARQLMRDMKERYPEE